MITNPRVFVGRTAYDLTGGWQVNGWLTIIDANALDMISIHKPLDQQNGLIDQAANSLIQKIDFSVNDVGCPVADAE